MHLVMFDIDGTITASNSIDTECFLQALAETLGIDGVDPDWSKYRNATDQGCLEEIIQHHRNRLLPPTEVAVLKARHFHLLREKITSDPSTCQPIPGVREVLLDLCSKRSVAVSLATGAWEESAKIKLESAHIPYHDIPMASGDDDTTRTAIMKVAEERTRQKTGCQSFYSKTYVGDAIWDVQAARKLNYEFIGIAQGSNAGGLRTAGARFVVPDYRNCAFARKLEEIWNAPL